ncbi:nucleoside phosphorylase domain-containing protein [Amylostereum chailletii]|nr:nucleoside phosphorylase domain-containing protein [Amylostereum chailletii]
MVQVKGDPFAANVAILSHLLPKHLQSPRIGVVCGSGLSTLAANFRDVVQVPYSDLEGFGHSTVPGHKSALAFGLVGEGEGIPVVAMLGRFHPYEGHPLSTVVYPIRFMARLGVKDIIITNAAGSLNPAIPVGSSTFWYNHPYRFTDGHSPVVVVHDHIALPLFTGLNPLLGPPFSPNHARFLPLSDAYSRPLRLVAFRAAHALGLTKSLAEGTYAWVSGPTYETAADGRFLRAAGGDVVGMSTVPEVVVARDEGLNVLVLSLVTNMVASSEGYRSVKEEVEAEIAGTAIERPKTPTVSHDEVLAMGAQMADVMKRLVEKVITTI